MRMENNKIKAANSRVYKVLNNYVLHNLFYLEIYEIWTHNSQFWANAVCVQLPN